MSYINSIVKYTRTTLPKFRSVESFIGKNTDTINNTIGTTNSIISNAQVGRDLVEFTKSSQSISPVFTENYVQNANEILENHLDKLELTKNFNDLEKDELKNNLQGDETSFVTFALGEKPSILIVGNNPFIKSNENYDVIRRTLNIPLKNKEIQVDNTFILNKKLTKQTIEENKELYIKGMGLDENADTEEIYNYLIGENSPLKNNTQHDLIGITLGYSPINSIIFQLEQNTPNFMELRNDINSYKKGLLNTLLKEDSPYKDYDSNFKKEIATAIRNIGNNNDTFDTKWSKYGYSYRNIVDDDAHDQKLIRRVTSCYKKGKAILQEDT